MAKTANAEAAAIRLAELSREIEELEAGRAGLLNRVDRLRAELVRTGERTTSLRASADLLIEHLTSVMASMAELRALEAEMRELNLGLGSAEKESSAMMFEVDSLNDTVAEAEEELDRISEILLEGKIRGSRGH
ncbi:MAG TPA: hypothetical protein VNO14_02775 [Blastocatellia bacterium]|nr:hypothetical protein [Blastocatellia bacterium]